MVADIFYLGHLEKEENMIKLKESLAESNSSLVVTTPSTNSEIPIQYSTKPSLKCFAQSSFIIIVSKFRARILHKLCLVWYSFHFWIIFQESRVNRPKKLFPTTESCRVDHFCIGGGRLSFRSCPDDFVMDSSHLGIFFETYYFEGVVFLLFAHTISNFKKQETRLKRQERTKTKIEKAWDESYIPSGFLLLLAQLRRVKELASTGTPLVDPLDNIISKLHPEIHPSHPIQFILSIKQMYCTFSFIMRLELTVKQCQYAPKHAAVTKSPKICNICFQK